jgi:hypothetical protein
MAATTAAIPTTASARTRDRDVLSILFSSVYCGVDSSPTPQHTEKARRRIDVGARLALLYLAE